MPGGRAGLPVPQRPGQCSSPAWVAPAMGQRGRKTVKKYSKLRDFLFPGVCDCRIFLGQAFQHLILKMTAMGSSFVKIRDENNMFYAVRMVDHPSLSIFN